MPRLLIWSFGPGQARNTGSWLGLLLFSALSVIASPSTNSTVRFDRDIRPIFSDTCFPCHGFDGAKRKAGLRLDTAEGQAAVIDGRHIIQPGDLSSSELWRRVNSKDPKVVMPPPESGKKLTSEQIASLGEWIREGAVYQRHWAFEPPVRPGLPQVSDTNWIRNEIDRFILSKLEQKKLRPSPEASKETLIRRLALDLTGLPPSLSEVDRFVSDKKVEAFSNAVERLLSSPQYGEQMGRYWLDVARYGDTHGLHLDNERSMWPYRDWVVGAFNQNLPFDQFTIWQLAGDLLPNPTRDQLVASGFNRCNVSTSEGGAIDEEFQVRYAVDRVETTSATWMGLTMGCAVCHDHKLDPISQKEFYEMFSIFNNISENAMDGNALLPPPIVQLPTPEQEKLKAQLHSTIAGLETNQTENIASVAYDEGAYTNAAKPEPKELVWVEDDLPDKAKVVEPEKHAWSWVTNTEGRVLSGSRAVKQEGDGLHQIAFTNPAAPFVIGPGDKFFVSVYLESNSIPKDLMVQFHTSDGVKRANWGDGESLGASDEKLKDKTQIGGIPESNRWVRLEFDFAKLGLRPGAKIEAVTLLQLDGLAFWDKAGQVSINDPALNPDLSLTAWQKFESQLGDKSKVSQEIKDLLKKESAKRTEAERIKLKDYFLRWAFTDLDPCLLDLRAELVAQKERRDTLEREIVATMVSKELEKPRSSWVLVRGQYDKHGEAVGPGVPSILPPLPPAEKTNRLTFAQWLVDPNHPLTSRVVMNRLWQQFFGTGIVKTAEDFGTKGEWPSHPELLDWLATEFIRSGWDVKHMVRLIVGSATYRQDSRVTPELWKADPENRLLARGPRRRLDAEVLRDSALCMSGLLKMTMGGKGVRPYQPAGIWEAVGYTTSNTAKYSQEHGDALYRRSLYLFWKRTAPPPSMTTFDAPSREQCRARRERTNTPLQALLTMNDIQYFEAARNLGYRMLHEGGSTDADRIRFGFRLVTSRLPHQAEFSQLMETLAAERAHFGKNPEAAKKVISTGESPVPTDIAAPELAAFTMAANLLLNLDEAMTNH